MIKWNYKIAKLFGTDVLVNITFFIFLAAMFGVGMLNGKPVVEILLFLLFLVVIFACVLAHEFGHSLMARRFGIQTERIVLSPIGGIAELKGFIPKDPKIELLVAIAGPLVNLVIFGLMLLVFLLSGVPLTELLNGMSLTSVKTFLALVMWNNLILFLFNVIVCALPMDGGRILRSLLSMKYGHVKATNIACWVSRVFCVLMLPLGYYVNPMFYFISAFVLFASEMERKSLDVS